MALILALGSNIGDREAHIELAISHLNNHFHLTAVSCLYESAPVDYLDQPYFLNQLLEFASPKISPENVLKLVLTIENQMGRVRTIAKGPRVIDIDIIFFDDKKITTPKLTLPHPSWREREFIFIPLTELPYGKKLSQEIADFPSIPNCPKLVRKSSK